MENFLKDPIWTFIGAVLTLTTIVVTIILYLRDRNRKALSFDLIVFTPIIPVAISLKEKVRMLYEDKPVQNVHLGIVEIKNVGTVPIVSSDFEEPLCFIFNEGTQILAYEVVETDPSDLHLSFNKNPGLLKLGPLLLNPNDMFVIRILLSNPDREPTIKASFRIVGIREFVDMKQLRDKKLVITSLISLAGLGALIVILGKYLQNPSQFYFLLSLLLSLLFLLLVGITSLYLSIEQRRKTSHRVKYLVDFLPPEP